MKSFKRLILLLALFSIAGTLSAQQKFTISGYITDVDNGEKLIGANVFDTKTAQGAVTNTYGFYSLTLPKDSVILSISYIGYPTISKRIYLDKDTELNFDLSSSLDLDIVTVTAEKAERIEEKTQMSQVTVPIETIKKLPALFGEVDVLKSLQLLPGVQSGGEGQSGLYVRGGSPDQNLVLLDGVPIYNVSHVLGIFSVFNADAIKNVTLTKGGFPARYGGRLSSVLEINMKEGNLQKFEGEGSIGLISSKLTLQGPIVKDKTSFLVSARRTYLDILARPIIAAAARTNEVDPIKPALYFYDMNAKIQHKFNNKHRLYLSAYNGADVFNVTVKDENEEFGGGTDWGNFISALRWNYQISPKLFMNTTATYSNYEIDIEAGFKEIDVEADTSLTEFQTQYVSGIKDLGGKVDFDFIVSPQHYIRFGAAATSHTYSPGALTINLKDDSFALDTILGSDNSTSMEYGVYIEDDINLGAFKANVGVHASAFNTESKTYTSLQPRVGLRYLLGQGVAVKASFARMTQYVNLLTSEALSLPTDLWVPSTDRVLPQESWQVAGGVAKTFADQYEVSIEGYYKKMENVVSYKPGESFVGVNTDWEGKVTQGTGESYGAEFFIQKKKGRFNGWIGYTLSWNWREFDEINGGERFPFRYDRRHDISVVGTYELKDNINLAAAWVYGTGNAVTLPVYEYRSLAGLEWTNTIQNATEKNSFRMSDYHRLDASIEFIKQKPRYERKWSFGVYNAYVNKNPYFITQNNTYDPVTGQSQQRFQEISILPMIPYFSWGFKF